MLRYHRAQQQSVQCRYSVRALRRGSVRGKGPPHACRPVSLSLSPWIHRSGSQAQDLFTLDQRGNRQNTTSLGVNSPVLGDHLTSWDRKPEGPNSRPKRPCLAQSCLKHKHDMPTIFGVRRPVIQKKMVYQKSAASYSSGVPISRPPRDQPINLVLSLLWSYPSLRPLWP